MSETLSHEIAQLLEENSQTGFELTKEYQLTPKFTVQFRTLMGEEEIEARIASADFRGPAYIYTYKIKILARTIYKVNSIILPPGGLIQVPQEEIVEGEKPRTVLVDTPVADFMEGLIGKWSKSVIDICFKLWSKHQEEQLVRMISAFPESDMFTMEERIAAQEYRRMLIENNDASAKLTKEELYLATSNTTPGADLVKLGAQVVRDVPPDLDLASEE